MANKFTNFSKMKRRCISCVYLCQHTGDTPYECSELTDDARSKILSDTIKNDNRFIWKLNRKCYKELMEPEEVETNTKNATCPSGGWRLHKDGKTPQMSLQHEQHTRVLGWTIAGVIITAIVLFTTLYFGFCK